MGPEAQLEQKCRRHARENGARLVKWVSPGTPGVPDRILLIPFHEPIFIEFKRPGGQLRPLQERWAKWLQENGFRVERISSFARFEMLIESSL
jgi:hypothetical protein